MHISPRGVVDRRASYPISGTDSKQTSTFGTGGPTVPTIAISLGCAMNEAAQLSVRPITKGESRQFRTRLVLLPVYIYWSKVLKVV